MLLARRQRSRWSFGSRDSSTTDAKSVQDYIAFTPLGHEEKGGTGNERCTKQPDETTPHAGKKIQVEVGEYLGTQYR
jgi:hypothetical protein